MWIRWVDSAFLMRTSGLCAVPSTANCDPWQGQSQHVSKEFQCRLQPMCVQIADRVTYSHLTGRSGFCSLFAGAIRARFGGALDQP
jgi:hypothetical protein